MLTVGERLEIADLMRRINLGDNKALHKFYRRYYRSIFCYILKIVRDESDAEDLTQEFFIKIIRRKLYITDFTQSVAYIFETAKNLSIDFLRKRDRNEMVELNENIVFYEDRELSSAEFRLIFDKLNEDEKKILLLRYHYNYSIMEIANKTGIPKRTLERNISKIKHKVKKILAERTNEK